jgi:hypothetical protein
MLVLPPQPTVTPGHAGDPNTVPPIAAQAAIPPTQMEVCVWHKDYKRASQKIHQFQENKEHATALVWGQCSLELCNKVKATPIYNAMWGNHDAVWLLLLIMGFCCSFDDKRQGTWALQQAKKKAFLFTQKDGMSNSDYVEEFMAIVQGVESYGGGWGQEPGLVRAKLELAGVGDPDNPTPLEAQATKLTAHKDFLAMMILSGANGSMFFKLRQDLSDDYAKGHDSYPTTVDGVLHLLSNHSTPTTRRVAGQHTVPAGDGVAFLQGQGQKDTSKLKCWHCGEQGHAKSERPQLKAIEEGTDQLNVDDTPEPDEGLDNFNIDGLTVIQNGSRKRL